MHKRAIALGLLLTLICAAAQQQQNPTTEVKILKFQRSLRSFSAAMYWKLTKVSNDTENLFFSPASISHTLGMVLAGTKENTAVQIKRAMRMNFTQPNTELNDLFKAVFQDKFLPSDSPVKTIMATRAFIKERYPIYKNYTDILEQSYYAETEELDFCKREEAAQRINSWVEQQTESLIKDLVKPDMLTCLTRLTLVNALYFKASWTNFFKSDGNMDFKTPGGSISVPFMRSTADYKIRETTNYTYIGIPYNDEDSWMIIIMPKNADAMTSFSTRTSIETYFRTFRKKLNSWTSDRLELHMPSFTVEKPLDVKNLLKKMFVTDLFDSRKADLSGMSKEFLYVSNFVHKAKITVNKEGTEAAAASAAMAVGRSLVFPTVVHVNRPFIYAIYQNDNILFMGRMVDPSLK